MSQSFNKTILVVDDSVTARITIKNLLEELGCKVLVAENGLNAIGDAIKHQPDLILLDLSMPIWSGFSTLSMLRKSRRTQNIPVTILSGKEEHSDRIRAKTLGAINYILKPCAKEDIITTLGML